MVRLLWACLACFVFEKKTLLVKKHEEETEGARQIEIWNLRWWRGQGDRQQLKLNIEILSRGKAIYSAYTRNGIYRDNTPKD